MDTKITFGLLCSVLVGISIAHAQLSEAVPSTTCTYGSISDTTFQECLSMLGILNTTELTPDDTCRYYAESVYCFKRSADASGGGCSIADIEYWYDKTITFLDTAVFQNCNVQPESSGLCAQEDRLSSFALISCRPYLAQMEATQCMLLDYFLNCAHIYLHNVHVTCSDTQLRDALVSNAAAAWLQTHHSSLNLRACFNPVTGSPSTLPTSTIEPGTSAKCVAVIDMFPNHDIINCIAFLQFVNLTSSSAFPRKQGCSLINEAVVCMKNVMKHSGAACSLGQMHDTLVKMLHVNHVELLGPGVSDYVTQCPAYGSIVLAEVIHYDHKNLIELATKNLVAILLKTTKNKPIKPAVTVDPSYATASICSDDFRLVTYLVNTKKEIFNLMDGLHMDLVCTTIETNADNTLQDLNASCTSGELWSVLKSPDGRAQLATITHDLDIERCGKNKSEALVADQVADSVQHDDRMMKSVNDKEDRDRENSSLPDVTDNDDVTNDRRSITRKLQLQQRRRKQQQQRQQQNKKK